MFGLRSTILALLAVSCIGGQEIQGSDRTVDSLYQELQQKDAQIRELQAEVNRLKRLPPITSAEPDCECADLECLENSSADCCTCDSGGWLDNLSVFLGLDGSKQPQDFGVNAHFGGRVDVNWGCPLFNIPGIGLQLGTALNASQNAVQVFEAVGSTTGRVQSFSTVGLFQRTDVGLVWGAAYDFLYEEYTDEFTLGQWRGSVGLPVDGYNEFGLRLAVSDRRDRGTVNTVLGGIPVTLDPITQGTLYWRHTWESQAETTVWGGIAESHNEANLAFPPLGIPEFASKDEPFVFGAEIHVPLNAYWSLFGQGNFIGPADTGTVDAYLGLTFYPGGISTRQNQFAPLLPVANNTTFSVDLSRS
jgi:hypothetical protein